MNGLHEHGAPRSSAAGRWWRRVRGATWSWFATFGIAVVVFVAIKVMRPGPDVRLDADGRAPDFELVGTDGKTVTLSGLRGRKVLVNFWATWCPPCRFEIPGIARFARNHPDVVVLGVAVDSGSAARLAAEKRRLEISYPVLVSTPEVVEAYGVEQFPTTVLVDEEGRVDRTWTGVVFGFELAAALWL